jgi:putative ABC transport system permease protein
MTGAGRALSAHRAAVWLPDLQRSFENLLVHKLRTLLTMLGMIFGVAAVLSMLSIGAGAQQQVMAFIQDLGVRNLIVEAHETTEFQAFQKVRQQSLGLSFRDLRAIEASVAGIDRATPRKRFVPTQVFPKPESELPTVFGVEPQYVTIANLRIGAGRFFTEAEAANAAPVCVLGDAVRVRMFGTADPRGRFVRVNEQWFTVIGTAGPQAVAQSDATGLSGEDRNNLIYVPTGAAMFRLEDNYSPYRDEIDGIYVRLREDTDVTAAAATLRTILQTNHHGANDYVLVVPAELLAEQQRTKRIFDIVMVALASISLLVGGIGIMNIMLASVLERTPEIGVRRAVGARQSDIIRQFVLETTLIAVTGGTIGLALGAMMSRLIATFAGWSTIVTAGSILLAFSVSVLIGLVFGVYPAVKAARLDPVKALHYQ